jgi:hypothetical protein
MPDQALAVDALSLVVCAGCIRLHALLARVGWKPVFYALVAGPCRNHASGNAIQ